MTWFLDIETGLLETSRLYPKPDDYEPSYGTAGFRARDKLLASTVFRKAKGTLCGLLMAIRALKTDQTTGICVTASHNPEEDNGVKLSEPTGEMLNQDWEPYANDLAQANDEWKLFSTLRRIMADEDIAPGSVKGRVLLARDTRASGRALVEAAAAGVRALGCEPVDLGVLTTPQLHWAVSRDARGLPSNVEAYSAELAGAFAQLVENLPAPPEPLFLDCANGVGAQAVARMVPALAASGLDMHAFNTGDGKLNGGCGADAVQKARAAPSGAEAVPAGARAASLDGDADRIVYWIPGEQGGGSSPVRLLDGDRIAGLAALLVAHYARDLPASISMSVGVVQTAYANGASTEYLRDTLGLEVVVTPTGVKHLHAAAHRFDVGIYFEANGHGMVLFSRPLLGALRAAAAESLAARQLLALSRVVNQTVGDAISGMLLVEAALRTFGWTVAEWDGLYEDLPSRQLVVRVPDRNAIRTEDAERRVASPHRLQTAIDEEVARYERGRAFVRPSGTEDVVRVYAEAADAASVDALARRISSDIIRHVGPV